VHRLPLVLAAAVEQRSHHFVERPLSYLTHLALSAEADRVGLTIRGRVFVATTGRGGGRVIEVGSSSSVSGSAAAASKWKDCEFLPAQDGCDKPPQLLAIGSASGEEELWLLPTSGSLQQPPTQLTHDGSCQRQSLDLSPSGTHAAVTDSDRRLWIVEVASAAATLVHTAVHYGSEHVDVAWSPDSRFLAFVSAAANTFDRIFLWERETSTVTAVTSDRSQASSPSWSADGRYLFFLSDRSLVNLTPSPWGARAPEPDLRGRSTQVFALALQEVRRGALRTAILASRA
jgi:tricorn protease